MSLMVPHRRFRRPNSHMEPASGSASYRQKTDLNTGVRRHYPQIPSVAVAGIVRFFSRRGFWTRQDVRGLGWEGGALLLAPP